MATSKVTITVNNFPAGVDNTQHLTYVRGVVAIGSGTYAAGGLALNWQAMLNAASQAVQVKAQGIYLTPIQVTFFSAGTSYYQGGPSNVYAGGFPYVWNKANNTLQILANPGSQAFGTGPVTQEMTDGTTTPAAVTSDVIMFEAVFVRSYS